jgi:hypothetical protein
MVTKIIIMVKQHSPSAMEDIQKVIEAEGGSVTLTGDAKLFGIYFYDYTGPEGAWQKVRSLDNVKVAKIEEGFSI